ncbi:MAG: hypothetical protein M1470_12025 [Bacteroidetes bacterium]|nr:hypothetical protein [Bacteroidota bacterium]MCL5737191.1 hypothetical protein [Bacteroidota bacterium]
MIDKYVRLPEFEKDLKALKKRYRTLSVGSYGEEDIENFIKAALIPFHEEGIDSGSIVEISDLGIAEPRIFKVRKFACRSLYGKGAQSGIRIIYAYSEKDREVRFIEIYYKGDKKNEDRERVKNYFKPSGDR